MITQAQVEEALRNYRDLYLEQDLVSAEVIESILIEGEKIILKIKLGFPAKGHIPKLTAAIKEAIAPIENVIDIEIDVCWEVNTHKVPQGSQPYPQIKILLR